MRKTYFLKSKELKEMYNIAEEIYSNTCLINTYCQIFADTEELYKIKPILKYTNKASDILYAKLIDMTAKIE